MFQLPEVEINDSNRDSFSEGIIINLADESKQDGDSAGLHDDFVTSVHRFDPTFFNVSDKEKLAVSFIFRLFGLTACRPHDVGNDIKRGRRKKEKQVDVHSEPSWLSALSMGM